MYQEMKFWFQNKYDDTNASGQVHLESGADSLPNVLEAFADFLRQAGFTYVESVEWVGKSEYHNWDNYFEDAEWDLFDDTNANLNVFDDMTDEELDAYEAERTYDEEYYDPFTRHVDWDFFFGPAKPTIKVGDKVRVTHPDLGDSKYVFGREGTVDTIAEFTADIHAGQIVRVEFQPPGISAGSFETAFWWINPDALEVIG